MPLWSRRQRTFAPSDRPVLQEGSRGPAVLELQRRLAALEFDPGYIDGVFGPRTREAVMAFQRVHELGVDGVAGPRTWAALDATMPGGLPFAIRDEVSWGLAHEVEIHYAQSRPIEGLTTPRKLPLSTDCSGFVTLCYKWAGAPDPNGRGYDGYGFTGTLLQHMRQIPQAQSQVGDLALWADAQRTRHVSLVLETGSDPLLVSHGSERGPFRVRFSAEHRYFEKKFGPSTRVYWLTLPAEKRILRFPRRGRALAPMLESDPAIEEPLGEEIAPPPP